MHETAATARKRDERQRHQAARPTATMRQQNVPVHCQKNSKVEGPTATVDFFLKFEIQPLTAGLKTRLRNPSEDPSRTSVTSVTKRISRAQNHQEIYTL